MTNKTKTILCVCALTASAFAWNATADEDNSGVNYNNENNGGAWYFYNPNHNTPGYAKETTFHALYDDSVLSIGIERNETDAGFTFGTYTYDTQTGKFTSMKKLGSVGGNGSTTIDVAEGVITEGSNALSGAFKANEVVGLWVQETGSDLVYLSDNSLTLKYGANSKTVASYTDENLYPGNNESYTTSVSEADANPNKTTFQRMQYTEGLIEGGDSVAGGVASVWFDNAVEAYPVYDNPWWNGSTTFGWPGEDTAPANQASIKFRVTGAASGFSVPTEDGPSLGGPLPGVWATIALAGAASAYLKRRRKENK